MISRHVVDRNHWTTEVPSTVNDPHVVALHYTVEHGNSVRYLERLPLEPRDAGISSDHWKTTTPDLYSKSNTRTKTKPAKL